MSSATEIRFTLKGELFDLLMLKKTLIKQPGIDLDFLNTMIIKKKAVMDAEDAAYVEKMIAEVS